MPIFEYHCRNCNHTFELLLQKRTAIPICPECGGKDLERLLSSFAVSAPKSGRCPSSGSCPAAGDHCCSGGCCHGH